MKTNNYLTVTEGLYGYMVTFVYEVINEKEDYDVIDVTTERMGNDLQYQFPTKEEAIANFENWRGDNWEDTPRTWKGYVSPTMS